MDPSMNAGQSGVHNQKGSTSSLPASQIYSQLIQLYAMLPRFLPDWCRENPFRTLVEGRSDAELCELYITWTQCIECFQTQQRAAVPMK